MKASLPSPTSQSQSGDPYPSRRPRKALELTVTLPFWIVLIIFGIFLFGAGVRTEPLLSKKAGKSGSSSKVLQPKQWCSCLRNGHAKLYHCRVWRKQKRSNDKSLHSVLINLQSTLSTPPLAPVPMMHCSLWEVGERRRWSHPWCCPWAHEVQSSMLQLHRKGQQDTISTSWRVQMPSTPPRSQSLKARCESFVPKRYWLACTSSAASQEVLYFGVVICLLSMSFILTTYLLYFGLVWVFLYWSLLMLLLLWPLFETLENGPSHGSTSLCTVFNVCRCFERKMSTFFDLHPGALKRLTVGSVQYWVSLAWVTHWYFTAIGHHGQFQIPGGTLAAQHGLASRGIGIERSSAAKDPNTSLWHHWVSINAGYASRLYGVSRLSKQNGRNIAKWC